MRRGVFDLYVSYVEVIFVSPMNVLCEEPLILALDDVPKSSRAQSPGGRFHKSFSTQEEAPTGQAFWMSFSHNHRLPNSPASIEVVPR